MKTNKLTKNTKKKDKRPFHLHLEYFFRLRICLLLAAGLLALAIARSDDDMLAAAPHIYAEGTGYVGSYLSEERLHPHLAVQILRTPTTSSGK